MTRETTIKAAVTIYLDIADPRLLVYAARFCHHALNADCANVNDFIEDANYVRSLRTLICAGPVLPGCHYVDASIQVLMED